MTGLKINLLTLTLLVATARAAEIKGNVVNASGGEPLGRVQVSVTGTHLAATTSDDGAFSLAGIPPGNYNLRLDAGRGLPVVPTAGVTFEF